MNIGGYDAPRSDVTVFSEYDRFYNNARNARMYFCMPHKFMDDDITILLSGKSKLLVSPEYLVKKYLRGYDMAIIKHPVRDCVYTEAQAAKARIKHPDELKALADQAEHYQNIGFPEKAGMIETGLFIRRNNKKVNAFNEAWWAEVCRWSYRDQVAFPVVLSRFPELKVNFIDAEKKPKYRENRPHLKQQPEVRHSDVFVDSFNIEFGYELLSAVPYAYEQHINGRLQGTRSGKWSHPLYYFSPDHHINPERRSWYNTDSSLKGFTKLPWTNIHKPEQPKKHFPPYKEFYANTEYKWDKPTLCICNRANIEWGHSVINYFDADMLDWMFSMLKDHYEIVYFPVMIPDELKDQADPVSIGDIDVARKHDVKVFTDIIRTSWNETLLKVFANCDHYITMNGGYSILASYFSGTNIIYSKPGTVETKELKIFSFWRWYPNINDVRTLHVPSYDDLKERVHTIYIDNVPVKNYIIECNGNHTGFHNTVRSALSDPHKNVNVIAYCSRPEYLEYTRGYPIRATSEAWKCDGEVVYLREGDMPFRLDFVKPKQKIMIPKTKDVTVKFNRAFREFGLGQIAKLPWIEAMYYIRRGVASEQPNYEIKTVDPVAKDTELKPKRKRKTRKA